MSDSASLRPKFWEHVSLDDMSDAEWEALCDGCGRCCLLKLEDEDTQAVHFTDVCCKLLDTNTCRCTQYAERKTIVPECLNVRPLDADKLRWLPSSCAYRRLHEGRPLADWHPLISQDPNSVHSAGIGVANRCVPENLVPVHELPQRLVQWGDEEA